MRPDEHKKTKSRRYQAKLRGREGSSSEVKEIQDKRKEREEKTPYKKKEEEVEENEDQEDILDKSHKQSFRRRKLEDNAYRYKEILATEDDNDAETMDFLQMIDDSENKTFDPSTYFQFKEEKDWDTSIESIENDTNEIYQNLMNIRFDSLELSLGSVALHKRLDLDEDLFLDDNDSWTTLNLTSPIVPKTIAPKTIIKESKTIVPIVKEPKTIVKESLLHKGQDVKAKSNNKQEIRSVTSPIIDTTKVSLQKTKSIPKTTRTASIQDNDDIDDFLKSLEDEDVKSFPGSNVIKKQPIRKAIGQDKASRKSNTENNMEEWLDNVLK